MDRNQELWYDKGYDDGHEVGYDKAKAEERKKILDIVEEMIENACEGESQMDDFDHQNVKRFTQGIIGGLKELKTRIKGGSDD